MLKNLLSCKENCNILLSSLIFFHTKIEQSYMLWTAHNFYSGSVNIHKCNRTSSPGAVWKMWLIFEKKFPIKEMLIFFTLKYFVFKLFFMSWNWRSMAFFHWLPSRKGKVTLSKKKPKNQSQIINIFNPYNFKHSNQN